MLDHHILIGAPLSDLSVGVWELGRVVPGMSLGFGTTFLGR